MSKLQTQKTLAALGVVIALSWAGILFLTKNNGSKELSNNQPIISITPKIYNFGKVSQSNGITSTVFELKNTGTSDLIIDKIETSCNCTSASIVFKQKEGPRFTMPGHGMNEKNRGWKVSIAPGDTAKLKVYYDPNVHKNFRGAAIREIYVFSNDPTNRKEKVRVELVQTD